MTLRQALDHIGHATIVTISVAILFIAGVMYSELDYAETHPRVVQQGDYR